MTTIINPKDIIDTAFNTFVTAIKPISKLQTAYIAYQRIVEARVWAFMAFDEDEKNKQNKDNSKEESNHEKLDEKDPIADSKHLEEIN